MNIRVWKDAAYSETTDVNMIWMYAGGELFAQDAPPDQEIRVMLDLLRENQEFSGKHGDLYMTTLAGSLRPRKLMLVGLGEKNELTAARLRKLTGKAIKKLNARKGASSVCMALAGADAGNVAFTDVVKIVAESALLADYRFKKYVHQDEEEPQIETLDILCSEAQEAACRQAVAEGMLLGQTTAAARDLVNEPANVLVPGKLAEAAQQAGAEHGFTVSVYDEKQIQEIGMKALLEVGSAAINPPRLIVMKYQGKPEASDELLGFVGKGLTYDSGGLSLKAKDSMITMKADMAGAAAVIGAMSAIAQAGLRVNIVAVIAACENMVSATGYRPGDIIETMAGKSVMITSTDAEGRLTLADAVHYIVQREGATRVIDLATLTGAAARALGGLVTAAMSTDDAWFQRVQEASVHSGERLWRIPLVEEYKEFLKCDVADLINSAGAKSPNMILGGLFIGEFIAETPWAHLDIAGTGWTEKASEYGPAGGTGVGVRTLYYLAKLSEDEA